MKGSVQTQPCLPSHKLSRPLVMHTLPNFLSQACAFSHSLSFAPDPPSATQARGLLLIKENGKEKLILAKVKDAVETPPPTVDVDEKVTDDLLALLNNSRCLLVTDKGSLFGIITKMDALRSLMKK